MLFVNFERVQSEGGDNMKDPPRGADLCQVSFPKIRRFH